MSMCWLLGPGTGTPPALAKQIIVDWQKLVCDVSSSGVVKCELYQLLEIHSLESLDVSDGRHGETKKE